MLNRAFLYINYSPLLMEKIHTMSSKMGCTFTTKTMYSGTTAQKTLNFFLQVNTFLFMHQSEKTNMIILPTIGGMRNS